MNRVVFILLMTALTSFQQKQGVELSFVNDSEETFLKMTVETARRRFVFTNLRPGERTAPVMVDTTYWFCQTVAVTQRDSVLFTGFCAVGESLITDGNLIVSYAVYPKKGNRRSLYANEVCYTGSAKNVGFPKFVWKETN